MIAAVYLFTNGMCIVFDEYGQQMSDYQGRIKDCLSRLLAAAQDDTTWHWAHYGNWTQPTTERQVRCFYETNFAEEQVPA